MASTQERLLSIVQINRSSQGGAGRAALRLHKGLLQVGQHSRYLVKDLDDCDRNIECFPRDADFERLFPADHLINKYYLFFNRTNVSNTYFSFSYPGYDLRTSTLTKDADVINLHWVDDFLSPVSLSDIDPAKPIVWTLHDQKPFTGGCHYSASCTGYENLCVDCPQILEDPFHLPSAILQDKVELFRSVNLTVVTPSQWLANLARKSAVFKACRIEVIPNSVETDVFFPVEKFTAKKELGIDEDVITIMFGTCDASEKRKGFHLLLESAALCMGDRRFADLMQKGKIKVLTVGNVDDSIGIMGIPCHNAGYVKSDAVLRTLYSASDLFVLPSIEDNLPNTVLESLACGTPVVSFDVGGVPDIVRDNEHGRLVETGNAQELARAIIEVVVDRDKRLVMGGKGTELICQRYKVEDQARAYLDLYNDLIRNNKLPISRPSRSPYGKYTADEYNRFLAFSLKKALENLYGVRVNSLPLLRTCALLYRMGVTALPSQVRKKICDLIY